jgi:hypothetical protein
MLLVLYSLYRLDAAASGSVLGCAPAAAAMLEVEVEVELELEVELAVSSAKDVDNTPRKRCVLVAPEAISSTDSGCLNTRATETSDVFVCVSAESVTDNELTTPSGDVETTVVLVVLI